MDNWLLTLILLIVAALAYVFLRKRPAAEAAEAEVVNAPPPQQSFNTPTPSRAPAAPNRAPAAPSQPASAPASSQPVSSSDPDQQVLDQLRAAGSNLSKPHQMEFYLYFPAEEAAEQVGRKLETEGFDGEVRRAVDRSAWLCLVYREMVPERAKLAALRKRFYALAREFGGEYDGWETKIEN